jgi:RsiW-degrading membrane proteinase PrsW (M82 family)
MIEFWILLGIIIIWMIILQFQPQLMDDLQHLIAQIQQTDISQFDLQQAVSDLIKTPGIALTGFVYIALLVPIVEELLKTISIWFLLGRNISAREGFLIGAAAGAGYALFENLTIGAAAEVWTFITISRLGTAAVHILASGLVGWGISSAWNRKKPFLLLSGYLTAVVLHGVWNGLNIFTIFSEFPQLSSSLGQFGSSFSRLAPVGLLILGVGSLAGLIWINRSFKRAIIAEEILEGEL